MNSTAREETKRRRQEVRNVRQTKQEGRFINAIKGVDIYPCLPPGSI